MVIGIDLGGMSAKAAILTDGGLLGKCSVVTSSEHSPSETAASLARLAVQVAETAGIDFSEVEAIGIGSPGVVDSENGTVVLWSNYHWQNVELAELVGRATGKRVFVTNDANAAALGEARYGAGMRYRDSILITLGTGVGGGIVLGGKLFEGYKSAGAEIGHMVIRAGGELCTCGRRGCFERYASATALIRMTGEALAAHPESRIREFLKPDGEVSGKTAFLAARAGDRVAQGVVDAYIGYLAEGIANLANVIRPQAVMLGGGVSHEGEALLAPLRERVRPLLYASPEYAPFKILCATLGNEAGLYGAAEYANNRLA